MAICTFPLIKSNRIIIEKQAEDPLPLGGVMNTVPTAIELEAKSISI
jgi:hypothetical protein